MFEKYRERRSLKRATAQRIRLELLQAWDDKRTAVPYDSYDSYVGYDLLRLVEYAQKDCHKGYPDYVCSWFPSGQRKFFEVLRIVMQPKVTNPIQGSAHAMINQLYCDKSRGELGFVLEEHDDGPTVYILMEGDLQSPATQPSTRS